MPDKTYAKVVLNGTTYVDLTSDTVDPSTLLAGYTAHDRSGALITGSFDTSIFVLKAGDTMTGPLILSGAPTENLHAATKKYVDDTAANYVTLTTDQNITGTKTFVGQKKILFKQSGSTDKLGFTLYNSTNVEQGYLEYNPTNKVDNAPLFTLGNYASSANSVCQVGFRRYSNVSGASGAYNLLTPLIADAKTPFSLTTTYTNFYLPLGFTDGTTTVKAAKSGLVDLSSILPSTSGFVLKSGDTMTGYLTLNGNPTSNLHAVTKQYVDNKFIKNTGEDYMHGDYVITDSDSLIEGTELVTLNKTYILLEENLPEHNPESPYTKIHKSYIRVRKSFYDDGTLDESYGTEIAYNGITIEDSVHNLPSYKSVLNNNALHIYTDTNLASEISDSTLKINGHDLLRTTPNFAQMFATEIPANANLNTTTYLKVGQYYVGSYATATSISNTPQADVFTMTVESLISSAYDDESTTSYSRYRMRTLKYTNGNIWVQVCSAAIGSSTWTYGAWQRYITGYTAGNLQVNTSGASLDETYCKQYGKTVNVRAWIVGLSTSTQTHTNIITVQSVDMPTTAVRFVFTCWLGNGIAAYAGYGVMDTSGRITLVKAVANSDKASFEFTYNV